MQLSKIKLSGFKSFVDPISIPFPSRLIGIVGPNGCGKSNIIDAVRWVMGEGSAKTLRGDSMSDVIFSGSAGRKPVGNASVELVFDNSDGAIGGQYASYAEIAIKRVVSRDGTSNYYLNNQRCRRKDITDIFHGTGLGPRSYSIIEQGMITRLIEAKPEELRVFLEEAAGISRYKERRRETENRIRHTRENIERLEDVRGEIEKQLNHLNRQARAAERYKELKEDERRVRAEVLALRWRKLEQEAADKRSNLATEETRLEGAVAEQRKTESEIESAREAHDEASETFNEVQRRFYSVGSDIARIEQDIQHARDMRQKQQGDLTQAEQSAKEMREHLERDRAQLAEHVRTLEQKEPELEHQRSAEQQAAEELAQAENAMQAWQQKWDAFTQDAGEPARIAEVERTRIDHLEREQDEQSTRRKKLNAELDAISPEAVEQALAGLEQKRDELAGREADAQRQLDQLNESLKEMRTTDGGLSEQLDEARNEVQQLRGRQASLEALQQAALGQDDDTVVQWLENHRLGERPRLGQGLRVEAGWERAVETVLGNWLQAVCVDDIDAVSGLLESLEEGVLSLYDGSEPAAQPAAGGIDLALLATKVSAERSLGGLLDGVYAAPDLATALKLRGRLQTGQSLVTPDGVWIGANWLRVAHASDAHSGVLARGEEIRELESRLADAGGRVGSLERQQDDLRAALRDRELEREQAQADLNRLHRERTETVTELNSRRERVDELEERRGELESEIASLDEQIQARDGRIRESRQRLEQAVGRMEGFERERETLETERETLRQAVIAARERVQENRSAVHELALAVQNHRSNRESLENNLARMDTQLEQLESRRASLAEAIGKADEPIETRRRELDELLKQRDAIEQELKDARGKMEEIEHTLRELEQQRGTQEQTVSELREALQDKRMGAQEIKVRQQSLVEQLSETGQTLEALFEQLPEDATSEDWEQQLEKLEAKINRLGPINLAAIDEYAEQSQRKEYLDAQHADLIEALTTLEDAIRKIDRETRTRFKETYDRVNTGLQATFPKLFGGGHAYLELTDDDLLNTGVTVMARPPGKRNTNIHLLSGGEKALTAVALVFAIFELNPSPFCMLDEVDAPLDDANVGRFCELVRGMSERVQFVMITHNKLTMELADQLTGVTMQEPGVSRLVAVDIDEAVHMAAS